MANIAPGMFALRQRRNPLDLLRVVEECQVIDLAHFRMLAMIRDVVGVLALAVHAKRHGRQPAVQGPLVREDVSQKWALRMRI